MSLINGKHHSSPFNAQLNTVSLSLLVLMQKKPCLLCCSLCIQASFGSFVRKHWRRAQDARNVSWCNLCDTLRREAVPCRNSSRNVSSFFSSHISHSAFECGITWVSCRKVAFVFCRICLVSCSSSSLCSSICLRRATSSPSLVLLPMQFPSATGEKVWTSLDRKRLRVEVQSFESLLFIFEGFGNERIALCTIVANDPIPRCTPNRCHSSAFPTFTPLNHKKCPFNIE